MALTLNQFGYDHWKLFYHLRERVTVHAGELDFRRMRCNQDRHPGFAVNGSSWKHSWGTRVKGGRCLPEHDDWDCLYDLEAVGLVKIGGTGVNPRVYLPPTGVTAWEALAKHRQVGGLYTDFQWA